MVEPRTATPRTRPPAIGDYGVVGNLRTAALISRFGSVDWACFPRFSSPSVFARILDPRRGGFFEVTPTRAVAGHQEYVPSTAILTTTFPLGRRRSIRLLDFLPVAPDGPGEGRPHLVRIVQAVGGPATVRVRCEPRFDYGRHAARWRRVENDYWVAAHGVDELHVRLRGDVRAAGGGIGGEVEVSPAQALVAEAGWGALPPPLPASDLLLATEAYWRGWVHRPDTPLHFLAGRWHRWVERSEITLKLLSHADTGAFVAAPTTSLPEWPGGSRNWDYRYSWVRDAAFTAEALLLLGHVPEAARFLRWVVGRIDERAPGGPLRVVYGGHGEVDLGERTLRHLAGYRGSRPVRVGNGAAAQFQLDIYGELLDAAYMLSFVEPSDVAQAWPKLAALAEEVAGRWREPDRGIWESRGPAAHYVYSKLMAWVALERAVRLARRFRDLAPVGRWESTAEAIRAEVLERGYRSDRGAFVQAFGRSALDAANLRIPMVGFLPFDDDRVQGTLAAIERELTHGAFVHRYRVADGLRGPEGAFLPCSFWMVECLARSGRREEAVERFEAILAAGSPLGLFSEEFDPRRRLALGNYPQGLSHIGLLRAALALGLSELGFGNDATPRGLVHLRRAIASASPPSWED